MNDPKPEPSLPPPPSLRDLCSRGAYALIGPVTIYASNGKGGWKFLGHTEKEIVAQ